jgi:hypothetical protein
VVVHQGVDVAGVGGDVAERVVGRTDVAVAEAPQVGHDHLEAGVEQRLEDPGEDALRLRPAVHEHDRTATADPRVPVRLGEPAGRRPPNLRGPSQ